MIQKSTFFLWCWSPPIHRSRPRRAYQQRTAAVGARHEVVEHLRDAQRVPDERVDVVADFPRRTHREFRAHPRFDGIEGDEQCLVHSAFAARPILEGAEERGLRAKLGFVPPAVFGVVPPFMARVDVMEQRHQIHAVRPPDGGHLHMGCVLVFEGAVALFVEVIQRPLTLRLRGNAPIDGGGQRQRRCLRLLRLQCLALETAGYAQSHEAARFLGGGPLEFIRERIQQTAFLHFDAEFVHELAGVLDFFLFQVLLERARNLGIEFIGQGTGGSRFQLLVVHGQLAGEHKL